ncbi:MAG: TraB/GumN family protein [Candidatus Moranbacteria bacterium]|nr:TraB/GumN family protein [Candidatus Moranbacteria bacterium]
MEKFFTQEVNATGKSIEKGSDFFGRIEEHSRAFDRETADTRKRSRDEIREHWRETEWKIGDTTVHAIGVMHVPETFLEYRKEIENAIKESDIVVNEFAPEALGLYDKESVPHLQRTASLFNEHYNLEQLRQIYLKNEREWNTGMFHHEIELLTAKYDKDMALMDLNMTKDCEDLLQGSSLYAHAAEQSDENAATLKKLGLYAGAAASVAGAVAQKPMSRRKFLRLALLGTGATIAGITPKLTETPPQTAIKKEMSMEDKRVGMVLRDLQIADSLQRLAGLGYKNITFIYGVGHLSGVGKHLHNPEEFRNMLDEKKEQLHACNSDAFRIYRLADGENTSEKFVASDKKVWKRISPARV